MSRRIESLELQLEKAKALMGELNVLLEHGFYSTVVHTLYYACFHATKALLLTKDLVTKTHKGVATLLYQQFVETGEFEKQKASFFKSLMEKRNESDYGDTMIHQEMEIKPLVEPAKECFAYVSKKVEDYLAQQRDEP